MHIAAHFADPAFFLVGGGVLLRLDMCMVVGVGAGLSGGQHFRLHHVGDVKRLRLQIAHIDNLAGEHRVGVRADVADAVAHPGVIRAVGKFVHIPAGLEAEVLEQGIGRIFREDGDIELSGFCHHVAGVVLLDDGDRQLLGIAGCHLAGGVDDAAVVFPVHLCGEHLHTVGHLLEGPVVHGQGSGLYCCCGSGGSRSRLQANIRGDRISHGVKRCKLVFFQGGLQRNRVVDELGAFQAAQRFPHELAAGRRPGAVLHQSDLPVAEVVGNDIVDQVFHRHKDARVVRCGGKHKVAAAESVRNDVARRCDGRVEHPHPHPAFHQLAGQNIRGVFRVAVNRSIGEAHALFLGRVRAPEQIFLKKVAEVCTPYRPVQRTDVADVQLCGLFQRGLNLCAILADDVGVVPARLVELLTEEVPFVGEKASVECPEGSEGVG